MPARKRVKSPKCLFYTVAEVGELFDISPRTVYTWVDLGRLPQPRRTAKWTRFLKADIDAVIADPKKLAG